MKGPMPMQPQPDPRQFIDLHMCDIILGLADEAELVTGLLRRASKNHAATRERAAEIAVVAARIQGVHDWLLGQARLEAAQRAKDEADAKATKPPPPPAPALVPSEPEPAKGVPEDVAARNRAVVAAQMAEAARETAAEAVRETAAEPF